MNLIIAADGRIRGIWDEEIALDALGSPRICRASHVEPDAQGRWLADLAPVGVPFWVPSSGVRKRWMRRWRGWMSTGWWIWEVVCLPSMRGQWRTDGHAPGCRTRRQVELVMIHPTVAASCSKEHRSPDRSDGIVCKFTSPECRSPPSLRNVFGRSRPGFFCCKNSSGSRRKWLPCYRINNRSIKT